MPEPTAVHVARGYVDAWTTGDFDAAMAYVDPDIECLAPAGPIVFDRLPFEQARKAAAGA